MKMHDYPPPLDIETAVRITDGFLTAETGKAGKERLVVGISGGVDSAVSAALAVRSLGKEALIAVKMPYKSSNPLSEKHADLLIEKLGVKCERVDITAIVDAYFAGDPDAGQVRRGNFMARARMSVLYDFSAKYDALVLGTGNKSEWLLGYTTLYGDSACALDPIGDLYKTQVYQLAKFLGIPDEIISKPPSADLWPSQTDEGDMGILYADADAVLYLAVDRGMKSDAISAKLGLPMETVTRIISRMEKMDFKRRLPLFAGMPTGAPKNEN